MNLPLQETRERLRRLADDMEEMGRRSRKGEAKAIYFRAADDARSAIRARHVDVHGLLLVLAACNAQANLAAWLDGGDAIAPIGAPVESVEAKSGSAGCNRPAAPIVPVEALNARQIADRLGIGERRARRIIERCVKRGLPGFYRDGCHWFAEVSAFEQATLR